MNRWDLVLPKSWLSEVSPLPLPGWSRILLRSGPGIATRTTLASDNWSANRRTSLTGATMWRLSWRCLVGRDLLTNRPIQMNQVICGGYGTRLGQRRKESTTVNTICARGRLAMHGCMQWRQTAIVGYRCCAVGRLQDTGVAGQRHDAYGHNLMGRNTPT